MTKAELDALREKFLPRVTELMAEEAEFDYAVAFTSDGKTFDRIGNLDSAIALSNEGYIVVVNPEKPDAERGQRMVSHELDLALDCFGADYLRTGGE
jgi:hypothetical protein